MSIVNKALSFSGLLLKHNSMLRNLFLNYKTDSLRIVYYHIVSKNKYPYYFDNKGMNIEDFEWQIKFFKKKFDIISLSHAMDLAREKKSLKKKLVITFDDGFLDNYTMAAPILSKFKCTATFFLMGNCVDNKDLMWRNKLLEISRIEVSMLKKSMSNLANKYQLEDPKNQDLMSWSSAFFPMDRKEEIVNELWNETMSLELTNYLAKFTPYMNSSQIVEMSNDGFEFGAHSMSHPDFSKLNYEMFKDEIINSISVVENITKLPVNSFAYPFGKRAKASFETRLMDEYSGNLQTFLGTRNKMNNTERNIQHWERDNVEFPTSTALSRFFLIASLRSLKRTN